MTLTEFESGVRGQGWKRTSSGINKPALCSEILHSKLPQPSITAERVARKLKRFKKFGHPVIRTVGGWTYTLDMGQGTNDI